MWLTNGFTRCRFRVSQSKEAGCAQSAVHQVSKVRPRVEVCGNASRFQFTLEILALLNYSLVPYISGCVVLPGNTHCSLLPCQFLEMPKAAAKTG